VGQEKTDLIAYPPASDALPGWPMTRDRAHMVAIGRLGGRRVTLAKRRAAQVNGRKGGRPRKLM